MKRSRRAHYLLLTTLGSGAITGCDSGEVANANLDVRMIDAPGDFAEVNVNISHLRLKRCGGAWVEVETDGGTLNLLSLTGGNYAALASDVVIPAGHYCEGRIIITGEPTIVTNEGEILSLKLPSGSSSGYKIKDLDFTASAQTNLALTLDFDADESIHEAGSSGKYVMAPTVRAVDALEFPTGAELVTLVPDASVRIETGPMSLEFPAGAVDKATTIWCTADDGKVECGPDGTSFLNPGLLTISVPDMPDDQDGTIALLQDGVPVPTVISSSDHKVSALVRHFTFWEWWAYINSDYFEDDKKNAVELPALEPGLFKRSNLHVNANDYARFKFSKRKGYRHTICATPKTGSIDIYSFWSPGASIMYNGQVATEDETGDPFAGSRFVAVSDSPRECIALNIDKDGGTLFVAVHGVKAADFDLMILTTEAAGQPPLASKLSWPTPECGRITYEKYGPFNSPWGNACPGQDPMFSTVLNGATKIHNAVDIYCPTDDGMKQRPVVASCTGTIKRIGFGGTDWGNFINQECETLGLSLTYMHVDPNSFDQVENPSGIKVGEGVNKGDLLGYVFDMNKEGEQDHLHFAVCAGDYDQCQSQSVLTAEELGPKVEANATTKFINPDCSTNPGLYDAGQANTCGQKLIAVHPATCE